MSKVTKLMSFNRVHEKKLFTHDLVCASVKLEINCIICKCNMKMFMFSRKPVFEATQ